jgi:hypothetical protein
MGNDNYIYLKDTFEKAENYYNTRKDLLSNRGIDQEFDKDSPTAYIIHY